MILQLIGFISFFIFFQIVLLCFVLNKINYNNNACNYGAAVERM